MDSIYIFHHIPKTAGISVIKILEKWFHVVLDYRPGWETDGPYFSDRLDLNNFPGNTCLCGHFELEKNYLHVRYPEVLNNDKFKLFTFVRNPLEMRLSLYYDERKRKTGFDKNMTLEEHLLGGKNYLANRFPCSKANYKDILSRYFFIGITELSQKSSDKLADIIGKPRVALPIMNRSERDEQVSSLPETVLEDFKVQNELDYLIYDYCLRKFDNLCQ